MRTLWVLLIVTSHTQVAGSPGEATNTAHAEWAIHTEWGQSDCSPATLYLHSTSWGFPRVIVQLLLPCNSWDDTAFLQRPACCNQGIPFALQRQTIKVFTGTHSQHCLSQADLGLTTCYRNTGCKETASLRVQVMSPAAQHRTASQPLAYLLSKCIRSQ